MSDITAYPARCPHCGSEHEHWPTCPCYVEKSMSKPAAWNVVKPGWEPRGCPTPGACSCVEAGDRLLAALRKAKFAMEMNQWNWNSDASNELRRSAYKSIADALAVSDGGMSDAAKLFCEKLDAAIDAAIAWKAMYDAAPAPPQADAEALRAIDRRVIRKAIAHLLAGEHDLTEKEHTAAEALLAAKDAP